MAVIVPSTRFHKAANLACLLALVLLLAYLFFFWDTLPEKLPMHYNFAGEVDRWGGRGELLLLPIIAGVLYIGMTVLEKFPAIWNTGVRVTEQNSDAVYREVKNLLVLMKLAVVLTFSLLTVVSSIAKPLPGWFMPVVLILVFGPIVAFSVRVRRLK